MKSTLFTLLIIALSACGTAQKVQYSALEKVGVHKRDILIDRIEKTTETQEETKQQFRTAYQELSTLVKADDQSLEKKYKKLARAVRASEAKTAELEKRITSVDEVAKALFREWQQELPQYESAALRQTSEKNLHSTQQRYAQIYKKMQIAQQRVQPVLQILQDNTLYLKHNLNARAVTSLSNEVLVIEDKVASLIEKMEASIDESKSFVKAMQNK